jgi:hypothetical protein
VSAQLAPVVPPLVLPEVVVPLEVVPVLVEPPLVPPLVVPDPLLLLPPVELVGCEVVPPLELEPVEPLVCPAVPAVPDVPPLVPVPLALAPAVPLFIAWPVVEPVVTAALVPPALAELPELGPWPAAKQVPARHCCPLGQSAWLEQASLPEGRLCRQPPARTVIAARPTALRIATRSTSPAGDTASLPRERPVHRLTPRRAPCYPNGSPVLLKRGLLPCA